MARNHKTRKEKKRKNSEQESKPSQKKVAISGGEKEYEVKEQDWPLYVLLKGQMRGSRKGPKRDIRVNKLTLDVPGKVLLEDANFQLDFGKKYGLVGRNGLGK